MSSKAIPPSRRKAPSFPERKNVRTVLLPLQNYPYWVIDLQQKAIYYHTSKIKLENNIERLRQVDKNKVFKMCPKYEKECQKKTAS